MLTISAFLKSNKYSGMKLFNSIFLTTFLILIFSCNKEDSKISLIGEESATIQSIRQLKSKYEVQNKIPIDAIGYTFEESFEKTNVDFASKSGKYDIIMQYNFSLSSYVRNDYVFLLDDLKKEASTKKLDFEKDLFLNVWQEVGFYYSDVKNTNSSNIKPVAYPFAANSMVLAYNIKMFEDQTNKSLYLTKYGKELAPPVTWDDFKNIAAFFTDKNKNTYGVCLQGSSSDWLYYEWVNFAFGMGGGTSMKKRGWEISNDEQITINSAENIKATELYIGLKPYNKGSFFDVDMNQQAQLFNEGNVAMAIMWSDVIHPTFFDSIKGYDNRFAFTTIPGNVSMIAGGGFFINKNSKEPQKAFDFLVWLMQKENQVEMVKNGLCSPLSSVYNEPELQKIPYLNAVKSSLKRGVFMLEAGPDADIINQKISEYVQRSWKGELTPKEALNKAQLEIIKERKVLFSKSNI